VVYCQVIGVKIVKLCLVKMKVILVYFQYCKNCEFNQCDKTLCKDSGDTCDIYIFCPCVECKNGVNYSKVLSDGAIKFIDIYCDSHKIKKK
jgi:hypothetical protein